MDILLNWFDGNKLSIYQLLIDLVVAIAIIFIGKFIANLTAKATGKLLKIKKVDQAVISFVTSIVFGMAFFVAIIAAISHLGFNTSSLVAIVGATGLAFGLALQGSLSNFASGVLIIALKPFKSGDFVEVAGIMGVVEEIHIFATKFKTGIEIPYPQLSLHVNKEENHET